MATAPPEEDCGVIDIGCRVGDAVGGAVGDAIQNMADAVLEATGTALVSLGTLWVNVGTPNLTTSTGGSTPSDAVAFLQSSLWYYMAGAAVLAVIVGGARMAWERRADPGRDLLKSLITLTVVSGAGLTGIALAVTAADGFAASIIDRSTQGSSFGDTVTAMVGLTTTAGGPSAAAGVGGLGAILVIILGLVAIVSSFVQIMFMVVRAGMLVILAGILPLAASFTSTEMGRAWFKKALGWTLAFILYKPAAAIVYATAFRLTGTDVFGDDGSGLINVLVGLVLMVLALFALPALLRFVTPMVSQLASGSGGAALGAGALAALPTGAIAVGSGGRGSGAKGSGSPIPAQSTGGSSANGSTGPTGGSGASSSNGRAAASTGASGAGAGASGAPAGKAGAAAGGSSGGAAAGARAGAAGGPAGMVAGGAAGAAADGAKKVGQAAGGAARQAAQSSTSNEKEGPGGSS